MITAEKMDSVRKRLHGVRRTLRSLYLTEGIARVLLTLIAFLLLTFALDFLLDLPVEVRLVLLGGGILWVLTVLWRKFLRRLAIRIPDDDLALLVEREYPELRDRLISAVQFARQDEWDKQFNSPELVEALITDAEQATASIDFKRVIVHRHVLAYGLRRLWQRLNGTF